VNRLICHTGKIIAAEIAWGKRIADPKRPKKRIAITDQAGLLNLDPRQILIGEIEVYDPRERPPR
jgi:hypothetical protein